MESETSKGKVLILDDRRENIVFLANNILKPQGYEIITAMDGEKGLEKVLTEKPDLVISDIKMPKMDGLAFLRALREKGDMTPVIFTTFHGSEQTAIEAFRLGARDYLTKPYTVEEMLAAVERVMQEEQSRRPASISQVDSQLEQRLKELNILFGIGKAVTSMLELEKLLNRIVEAAIYLTGAEESFLMLVDEETNELYMRAGRGLGEKHARGFRLKVDDSLVGQVVKTGKPVIFGSARKKFKVKTDYLVKSLLNVPLKAGEKVIGVLSVDNMVSGKEFTNKDIFLLSALADYAAIAIENARLYQKSEEEARKLAETLRSQEAYVSREEIISQLEQVLRELESERASEVEQMAQVLRAQASLLSDLAEKLSVQLYLPVKARLEELARRSDLGPALPKGDIASSMVEAQANALQSILNGLSEGIIVGDMYGQVILANSVAGRLLGFEDGPLAGRPIKSLCRDYRWEKNLEALYKKATSTPGGNGSEVRDELGLWPKMTFWVGPRMVRANMSLLTDAAQATMGVAIVLRDITHESQAQRLREELTLFISSELRTPLTAIMTYTGLMLEEAVGIIGKVQRRFLNRIRDNVERISAVLDGLVDDRNLVELRVGEEEQVMVADVGQIIEEVLPEIQARLGRENVRTEIEVKPNLPPVEADYESVRQIVIDLLSNAYQCTPAGGLITVQARLYEEEKPGRGYPSHLIVSIRDSGGGVALEDQAKVFNRFYWTESSSVPGLGMGVVLPVVKALVEAYGGRLWMESEPGVGNIFSFILPVVRRKVESENDSLIAHRV